MAITDMFKDIKKIVSLVMPKVNEMEMIEKYGFGRWVSVVLIKSLVLILVFWLISQHVSLH